MSDSTTISSPNSLSVSPTSNSQISTSSSSTNSPAPVQNCAELCTPRKEISDLQRKAILLILAGKSDSAVACIIGVHRNTVTTWRLRTAYFRVALHEARDQLWSAELDKLRALLFQSLKEIQKQLKDPYSEIRFRAAKTLLPLVGSPRLEPRAPKPEASLPMPAD